MPIIFSLFSGRGQFYIIFLIRESNKLERIFAGVFAKKLAFDVRALKILRLEYIIFIISIENALRRINISTLRRAGSDHFIKACLLRLALNSELSFQLGHSVPPDNRTPIL